MNLSQIRFRVRSPGFSRQRVQPAKAGTPNRLVTARFTGSFGLQFLDAHRRHKFGAGNIAELINSAIFAPCSRFIESFDFQFWTHIGAVNQAPEKMNAGVHEVRDSFSDDRFIESFDEHALARCDHELAAKDHCGVGQLRNGPRTRSMESFDLQSADAHCSHEPANDNRGLLEVRDCPRCPRFMGSFDEHALAHCDLEPGVKNNCGVDQLRNCPRTRFMESLDLQRWTRIGAMNVARLSKVETGRAMGADSTLESRATCRFMERGAWRLTG